MNKDDNILGREDISKLLLNFAIPSIFALIISSLYNIVDQIFIGNSVGMLGNAATNVAFPLTTICTAIALLCGIGAAANFNISLGRGDKNSAKHYIRNAISFSIIAGLIFIIITQVFMGDLLKLFGATDEIMTYAIQYVSITSYGFIFLILVNVGSTLIRADGSPKFSMYCMVVGCILNVVLDPIFIFIFNMGMAGAALATVIGQFVSLIMVVIYFKKDFKSIDLENKFFEFKLDKIADIAKLGAASGFNQVAILFVQVLMNNFYRHFGALSEYGSNIPLAAVGIVMKVNMIFFCVNIGLSQGLQPISSFNYGAKKYDRVIEVYKKAAKYAILVSTISFVIFQIFPRQILNLFGGGSPLYYEFGVKLFRIMLFFTFINGLQPVTMGFLTSIGLAKKGILISLLRQVILLVPFAFIFANIFGIKGLLFAAPTADFITAICTVIIAKDVLQKLRDMSRKMI
ncbi:MATE family efflux transporter [Peptoniphilus sp. MSJ-1]|uniref:Multidrug export protein MepA n=1 Tax=Peptoniphilus ovalis TaxID=2841503 RepID=A0ABS6FDT9_9FIRM|nr:MATE family efflux transporter [Peptoniphilus ovalis]MBU5668349.1 MATE family efflux transporter [Peptoniphilus ovalis]